MVAITRIAAQHGSFSRFRQVAPIWSLCFTWVHTTKRHLNRLSRFCNTQRNRHIC